METWNPVTPTETPDPQEGWAYRQVFTSNQARTDALQPWLDFYNHHRPHGSLGGKAPVTRCN